MWELKSYKRLLCPDRPVRLYGGPYHRPTGLLTNCPWLVKAARLCREAGPHRHIPVEDKASEAAEYPFDMCDQWAEAFSQWISNQGIPSPGEYIREGAYANKLLRPEFDPSRKRQRTNQTSSKEAREQENDECVGGMRNPHHAVAKGSGWISWGRQARVTLDEVLRRHPGVLQLVDRLGTEMSDNEVARLQDQLQAAGATASKQMAKELGLQGKEGTEKGPTGWGSPSWRPSHQRRGTSTLMLPNGYEAPRHWGSLERFRLGGSSRLPGQQRPNSSRQSSWPSEREQ